MADAGVATDRRLGTADAPVATRTPWSERAWSALLWGVMTLFLVNVALMIAAVATNSFASRWLGT